MHEGKRYQVLLGHPPPAPEHERLMAKVTAEGLTPTFDESASP